jgi:hypothetical protein
VDLVQHEISVLGFPLCVCVCVCVCACVCARACARACRYVLAVSAALGPRDNDGVFQKSFLRSSSPSYLMLLCQIRQHCICRIFGLFFVRVTSDLSLQHIELCNDDMVYFVGFKERLKERKGTRELLIH